MVACLDDEEDEEVHDPSADVVEVDMAPFVPFDVDLVALMV